MSTTLTETYACIPTTERGRGILISGDPKTNAILYTNNRSIIIRYLDRPLEVSVYPEHSYQTTVARFSPNGEWVASADVSGMVRIWGTRNEFVLKNEFRVLSGRIDDLQWSPDGMRIVASGDGKGKSFVRAFIEWVAPANVSGIVRIWGTRNEFVLKNEFRVLSGRFDDLQWSPDGMRIVASGDGKGKSFVRAFMWDSGTSVGEFDGHSKRVLSCAFKPTRPFRIVTCGEDFLVNFYEGPPFKFKLSHRDHGNFVNCVRFSPDGSKFITVSSDKKGLLCDAKSGERIGELSSEDGHKGSIYAVSWSPDGKEVLTVSADKTAKIWEISEDGNGVVKKTLASPGSGGVEDMLVGCLWQNDYLVLVSLGGTISLFTASDLEKEPTLLSGHMKNITSLSVLASSPKVILSSSYDGSIVRWIQGVGYSGKLDRKVAAQIKCFAAVEEEIVSSGFDNKIWRNSLQGDQFGDADSIDIGSQPKDVSLALNSPGLTLVAVETGVVLLQGTTVVSTTDLGFTVTASAITPDGSEAVVGAQDGKLHMYSINGDTLTEDAVLEKHRGPITVISYSPDISMFASGDSNREAVVWDRTSREVKLKDMLYHTARINCLAWSPDNSLVATGSLDTCVIIYDISKPPSSRITIKGAHLGGVYGLSFIDECNIVSSGEDACIRLWTITLQ